MFRLIDVHQRSTGKRAVSNRSVPARNEEGPPKEEVSLSSDPGPEAETMCQCMA